MKRVVVQMRPFSRFLDELIRKNKVSQRAFEDFERKLVEYPQEGSLIKGSGGIRKIRFGGVDKGKSGSYRVIYFDYPTYKKTYLIAIYEKNLKENLSKDEISELKKLVNILKSEAKHG